VNTAAFKNPQLIRELARDSEASCGAGDRYEKEDDGEWYV